MILHRRIAVSFTVWLQMTRIRVYRLLRMRVWFPHVPLALVVVSIGLAELLPSSGSLEHLIAQSAQSHRIVSNVTSTFTLPNIRGVPQEAIGALLLLVGIGLLWRLRLAWVLTFLLALATTTLALSPLATGSKSFTLFSIVLLLLLLAFRTSFNRATLATSTLFALTSILFAVGYGILGSYVLGSGFDPPIRNAIDAIYFAVVTMSTVGFGDVTPRTPEARLFTLSLIVLGLVVFATSLTAVIGPLIDSRMARLLQPKRKRMRRSSHIIVAGSGSLARTAIKALATRGLQVTAIWPAQRADDTEQPEDLVLGDASDTEALHNATIEQARALLALSEDDSYNAFVILAAKELNPNVRTAIAVNDVRNIRRAARVHADVVLALPLIGGELLAMALSGEEVKADELVSQLLKLA